MDQFQKEQNDLLKYILNLYTKKAFTEDHVSKLEFKDGKTLELFITPYCNQQCSYCYLVKNADKLYPKEATNPEIILKNLEAIYKYIVKSNLYIPKLDFFSGEIWGMPLGNKVFDLTLKYANKGLKIDEIMIPSNCSFALDQNIYNSIKEYVKKFKRYNINLAFSASIDGQIVEKFNRPYKNKLKIVENYKNDKFYDNLIDDFFESHWGFHPMIAASTIEYQKENYIWWHNKFIEHGHETAQEWYNKIMFLEVRNDDWTEDKIYKYIDWLNFTLDYDYNLYWADKPLDFLFQVIFRNYTKLSKITNKSGQLYIPKMEDLTAYFNYMPSGLTHGRASKQMNCSAGNGLVLRVGDLAILTCHRTAYEKLVGGKLLTNANNEIYDVEAINPNLLFTTTCIGERALFKCNCCPISSVCVKGCLGAQYEATGDIFYPIDSVCNLFKARFIYLYRKVYSIINKYHLLESYNLNLNNIDEIYSVLKNQNKEEVLKWENKIKELI